MRKTDYFHGIDGGRDARPTSCISGRSVLSILLLCLPLVALAVLSMPGRARAHIIPPEKLHPVAEAYRRVAFVLNLNPIRWELVRKDAATITRELADEDLATANEYQKQIQSLIDKYLSRLKDDEPPTPSDRKETARKVFELCTRAVAKTLTSCLASVEGLSGEPTTSSGKKARPTNGSTSNRSQAEREFNEARQIWASFEHEVRFADPAGYSRLGDAWLEASSAMGSAGVLGVGEVPMDTAKLTVSLRVINGYVQQNFVDYQMARQPSRSYGEPRPPDTPLVALPLKSGTCKEDAYIPVKLPPASNINKQIPRPRQILNMVARGVDESETALIAVGDMAFDSAYIFGEPARSLGITCNVCHNKGVTNPNFFIPGLSARPGGMDVSNSFFEPQANNGHFGHLDTPDLRGIRFTAPYGRNGRNQSLREFVRNVIVLEFNGAEPDPMVVDGMVAYMNEFDFLPNRYLNRDGSLNNRASAAAKRGERIFNQPFKQMGNRACASCHIPSDHFLDRRRHNIGTVGGAEPFSLDRALDTPTLLNSKYTQPYFHDGSQPTLRAVNEWFNKRYKLGLTRQQIDDLTAYVETAGEGSEAYEDTPYYLDAEMEEFSFFLSAYEFLKSQKKWDLIDTTLFTIATEIRNHKWELQDPSHMPIMDQLAQLVDEARNANAQGDRKLTDAKVAEYRRLYRDNVERLK